MKERTRTSTRTIRAVGWVWIVLSPIIFLMAAISTVKSLDIYYAQLAIFSAVSFVALGYGVAAVAGASWAPRGLLILSWLGSAFFFGSGLLIFGYGLFGFFLALKSAHAGSPAFLFFLGISVGVAATGMPFFLMARSLHATWRNREKLDAS